MINYQEIKDALLTEREDLDTLRDLIEESADQAQKNNVYLYNNLLIRIEQARRELRTAVVEWSEHGEK